MTTKFKSREAWLQAATVALDAAVFAPTGQRMPKLWRVTCGWPSVRALSAKKRRIGECWDKSCSKDKHVEIIISMKVDDAVEALDILVHEMVHGVVGCACGHKGPFAKLARKIGLEGKLTSTKAGAELNKQLKAVAKKLGSYPHAGLDATKLQRKVQTTRLIKCVCPDTGYVVRTTRQWIDEYGPPYGPEGSQMEEVE